MALLPRLGEVLGGWGRCFVDRRTFRRAKEHALALLVCLGRRTISRSICVLGRQFRNWTPEYRLFSRCRWKTQPLFDAVLERLPRIVEPASAVGGGAGCPIILISATHCDSYRPCCWFGRGKVQEPRGPFPWPLTWLRR